MWFYRIKQKLLIKLNQLRQFKGLVFFVCLVVSAQSSYAADGNAYLAEDSRWLVLNYYNKGITGKYYSEIQNKDYFIAPDGQSNPQSELLAFRILMKAPQNDSNVEILCRFPARITFLQKNDPLLKNFKRPVCDEYNRINRPENISSASLVFASGYFDNPSSYFGHVMLKFNYEGANMTDQAAVDSSLNYGANGTDSPSNPMYVIRGLFGGYDASYKRANDFLNSHMYTNIQIRDLWEYKLKLPPEQKKFLVEHSWEMMRAKFDYYFFNDNCAHRIARLIEETTGKKITANSGFWLLPTQVIRHLNDPGVDIVDKEIYLPSLKSNFSKTYSDLDAEKKRAFIKYLQLDPKDQPVAAKGADPQLLKAWLDYLNLELAKLTEKPKNANKISEIYKRRAIVLSEMLGRTTESLGSKSNAKIAYESLMDARPPSSMRLDYGYSDRNFARLSFRVANNDLLDKPISGQEISRFIMGGLQLEYEEGRFNLRKATLVDILNLNTNPLPESLTNEFSWGFRLDYAPRNELCRECKSAGIEGKFGKSAHLGKGSIAYGLAGARIHSEEQDTKSYSNLVAEAGVVTEITDDLSLLLSGQYTNDPFTGTNDSNVSVEARQKISDRVDLRISAAANKEKSQITAGISAYFD